MRDKHTNTWLISSGRALGPGMPLNVPPVLAANYVAGGTHEYSRVDGSPTIDAFEEMMGGLEGGFAVAFSSGMAACASVFDQLHVDSRVVLPTDCYHGVSDLVARGEERGRWNSMHLEIPDTVGWIRALTQSELVWLESPSNPLLEVADLISICGTSVDRRALVVVDNTFATPLLQKPLEMGADIVIHSATKFIGGHADLVAGVAVTREAEVRDALVRSRMLLGAVPGSIETFLALRGARTLELRLTRAMDNARELASRLDDHERVKVVYYPGLPSHATHQIAKEQMSGFGAVITFEFVGNADETDDFIDRLGVISSATSLGGVESTIERRARWSGKAQIPPGLVRLSVGCEHIEDLWVDLAEAL